MNCNSTIIYRGCLRTLHLWKLPTKLARKDYQKLGRIERWITLHPCIKYALLQVYEVGILDELSCLWLAVHLHLHPEPPGAHGVMPPTPAGKIPPLTPRGKMLPLFRSEGSTNLMQRTSRKSRREFAGIVHYLTSSRPVCEKCRRLQPTPAHNRSSELNRLSLFGQ